MYSRGMYVQYDIGRDVIEGWRVKGRQSGRDSLEGTMEEREECYRGIGIFEGWMVRGSKGEGGW